MTDVQIRSMPAMRLAAVAHRGPYDQIPSAFARLGQLAGQNGLIGPDAAMLAVYYDNPDITPAGALRSDAALTVAPGRPIPSGLVERQLAAGRYATITHVGPYDQLHEAWRRLKESDVTGKGSAVGAGPSYEIYRNTPGMVPDSELITELYLPLG